MGGFGYGLKDTVLAAFVNDFQDIQLFVYNPAEEDKRFQLYRGMIDHTRWAHHDAPTLRMKAKFMSCPKAYHKYIMSVVGKLFRETKATSGKNDQRKVPCTVVMLGSIVQGETAAKAKAKVCTNLTDLIESCLNPHPILALF